VEKFPNWTKDHFVSNGPFMLDQYQIKSAALLKKNPFYWDCGSVKTDSLSFAIIEDTSTAYNMFLAGELDWYGQPFIAMMRTEFTHELERKKALHKMGKETIRWLVCNTQKKHLSTPEIRRALSLGIDRLSLCKDLLQREESPIYSILPKSLSFFPFAHQKADPAAAKKLLRSALGAAGFQNDEIPTFHLLVRMNPVYVLISQAIQAQLKKDLDIDIQFELCESSVYWQRLSSGKFDLAFGSWFSWFADPMYNLNILRDANSGIISTPWESTEYKKLLCAADLEQDQEKRNTLLREAELLIMTELPIIPICSESGRYAKTNIQGEIFSTIGELDLKEIERAP
jgi:oligopeptide transport system substrate-binding protein